jgi:hypothetical protein
MAAPWVRGAIKRVWAWAWWALAPVALAQQGSAPPRSEGRLVDRVVAVIEDQVLTLSELEFETRVALVQRAGVQAAEAPLGESALRAALELAISHRLLVLGADKVQAFEVEGADLQARLESFRERLGSESALLAFLTRHDADVDQLKAVLERSLRAERILDGRIRLRAQVGELELQRYYKQNEAELKGPYAVVRDSLREKLFRERYGALAAAELAQVQAGARVRRVAPFAREAR